jgi:aromatic-L-amino-acid decarboxylase
MVRRAFSLVPEYLSTPEDEAVNYMDYGLQLGRRFRALKLWFVLRHLGAEGIRAKLRQHIELAQLFASWVRLHSEWEILAPHPLSVVCFRWNPGTGGSLEFLNARLMRAVNATGELFISHTKIDGEYALRLAIGNLRTQRSDVERAWDVLRREARTLADAGSPNSA